MMMPSVGELVCPRGRVFDAYSDHGVDTAPMAWVVCRSCGHTIASRITAHALDWDIQEVSRHRCPRRRRR